MKRKFWSLFLALTTTLTTATALASFSASAMDIPAKDPVIYEEDFQGKTAGQTADDWEVLKGTDVTVKIEQEEGGNKYLRVSGNKGGDLLARTDPEKTNIHIPIDSTRPFTLSMKMRFSALKEDARALLLLGYPETNEKAFVNSPFVPMMFRKQTGGANRTIVWTSYTGTENSYGAGVSDVDPDYVYDYDIDAPKGGDEWYPISIKIDPWSKALDFKIEYASGKSYEKHVSIVGDLPDFLNEELLGKKVIDNIGVWVNPANGTQTVDFDDIKIAYDQKVVWSFSDDFEHESGSTPTNWTDEHSSRGGTVTVKTEENGNKYMEIAAAEGKSHDDTPYVVLNPGKLYFPLYETTSGETMRDKAVVIEAKIRPHDEVRRCNMQLNWWSGCVITDNVRVLFMRHDTSPQTYYFFNQGPKETTGSAWNPIGISGSYKTGVWMTYRAVIVPNGKDGQSNTVYQYLTDGTDTVKDYCAALANLLETDEFVENLAFYFRNGDAASVMDIDDVKVYEVEGASYETAYVDDNNSAINSIDKVADGKVNAITTLQNDKPKRDLLVVHALYEKEGENLTLKQTNVENVSLKEYDAAGVKTTFTDVTANSVIKTFIWDGAALQPQTDAAVLE